MSRAFIAALVGAIASASLTGCSRDSCEVDPSGPECKQTFTLDIPGSCVPANVSLSSFYNPIINARCATPLCHVRNGQYPEYGPNDMATFLDQVLQRSPSRDAMPLLKYIKPNDPDNSFLLYKVVQDPLTMTTQQGRIQLGGAAMPIGQAPLSAAEQCTLINWVRSGAN